MDYMSSKFKRIIVFFDTNPIHNANTATELFRKPAYNLIKSENDAGDLNIEWYISDVVLKERKHQMQSHSKKISEAVALIENFLKKKINIDDAYIENKINEYITQQLQQHNIKLLSLDLSKVNFNEIIENACYRKLPFEPGEKEKGFKDAMIAETFIQLINNINQNEISTTIIYFVSEDGNLNNHIYAKTNSINNIFIVKSIEELAGQLNILCSQYEKDEITKYQKLSSEFFLKLETKQGFYYSDHIYNQISSKFKKILNECPDGIELRRSNAEVTIFLPEFVKKERKRITWNTKIEFNSIIYKSNSPVRSSLFDSRNPANNIYNNTTIGLPSVALFNNESQQNASIISSTLFDNPTYDSQYESILGRYRNNTIIAANVKNIFNVVWNLDIDKLNNAKVEKIEILDTIIDQKASYY